MAHSDPLCAVLILAAGASTRMGSTTKQLLPWKGSTLLGHTINAVLASGATDIFVVLGANAAKIRAEHDQFPVEFILNPQWENGLGSSLSAGMLYLSQQELPYDGVLVLLADQPFIDADFLKGMTAQFGQQRTGIIATDYGNKVGVPALFGKAYFAELSTLDNDYGAKEVLAKNKSDIFIMDSNGKTVDVDTMETYNKLRKTLDNTL
tara:strand:+ start:838 stop:1458 length:621 start_codon:yes stop_codon:yes gene_type:complete